MKNKIINGLLIISLFVTFNSCKKNKYHKVGLVQLKDFGSNHGNLKAYYYEPKNAKPNMPMVVVLHGCSQNVAEAVALTGWNKLADTYGFYVLYPEQKRINNMSKCFNWFQSKDYEKNKGENLSIYNMVKTMSQKFFLNSQAFYVTGMSAGAAMSTILISNYPKMFQGAAIMSGGPFMSAKGVVESQKSMRGKINKTPKEWGDLVRQQNPNFVGKYPNVIVFHGKNDLVVNFKNSTELIDQWSNVLKVVDSNSVTYPVTDVKRIDYYNINNENVLAKIEINHMGHALSINKGNGIEEGGGIGVFSKDKDYFSSYWSAKFFHLIP